MNINWYSRCFYPILTSYNHIFCLYHIYHISDRFTLCETAMIALVDRLLMNIDNGLLTGLSLINFRKAFDLVDHGVLLRKLVAYQLSEESIH